jgi:drug/metabolite transporter (DMT)-like permease
LPITISGDRKENWSHQDYRYIIMQSITLLGAAALYYSALRFISLATASVFSFLSPLFVVVMARAILKEHTSAKQWVAVSAGLLGAIIIANPSSGDTNVMGFALATASGFCNALYLILVSRSPSSRSPLVNAVASGAGVTFCLSAIVPFLWTTPTPAQYVLLLAAGASGAFAQAFVTFAYQNALASRIAPLAFLELIAAAVISSLVFKQFPTLGQMVGAAAIVCGVALTAIR